MAGMRQHRRGANQLNHNLYLSGDSSNPSPVTLRGNIISNDTSGSQIRIGGTITNNLWIQNPYAHNFAMPTAGVVNTIDNNVYTEAVALGGGIWVGNRHCRVIRATTSGLLISQIIS